MNADSDAKVREIAALIEAMPEMPDGAGRMFLEHFLGLLGEIDPVAARACAAALAVGGDQFGRALGQAVRSIAATPSVGASPRLLESQLRLGRNRPRVDVVLLTVKPVELDACLRAMGVMLPAQPVRLEGGGEVWLAKHAGTDYAVASVGTDGNVESALKMVQVFRGIDCRFAVLVGMAAGVAGQVHLGDVVVSEQVWAADFEILRRDGIVPRPKTYSPATKAWSKIGSLLSVDPEWSSRVRREIIACAALPHHRWQLPTGYRGSNRLPGIHTGVVFAGSRLIEDNSLVRRRGEEHGRLLAAEMEGAGFAAAVDELGFGGSWLVVRGVADFGEERRAKRWQFASTYAAAALVRDGISTERISIQ